MNLSLASPSTPSLFVHPFWIVVLTNKKELETKKSEYLSVFSSGELEPPLIDALDLLEIGKARIIKPDTLYKNVSGFLEEKIFHGLIMQS